jgi:hypothetical protein
METRELLLSEEFGIISQQMNENVSPSVFPE